MKQWKARWFVLDTEKNLLTYYDSEENPQLQGRINLEEMRGCRPVHPLPGAPKSADSRSFIEVSSIVGDLFTEADRVHNVDLHHINQGCFTIVDFKYLVRDRLQMSLLK